MRRRDFLTMLGGASVCAFAAQAEQRMPRVGFLGLFPAETEQPALEAFKAGLSALGYVPGASIEIEFRTAEGLGQDRIAAMARELVDLKVDVIVTGGPGVFIARRVTDTVPIVSAGYGSIDELIGMGIVASLGHPGGTVTGETFQLDKLFVKRVEVLKQLKPAMTRVGLLTLLDSPFNQFYPVLEQNIKALGLAPASIELSDPADCVRALAIGPGATIGGLMVVDEPQFSFGPGPGAIAAACLRHAMPAVGPFSFPRAGGLLSYAVDVMPMFHRAATFVDKILKGAKPGDIPIEQATKFETVVNLKTARALGIEMPPSLLAAADEVIE
jgi:putative ABC transport system substrate-binding protein